MELVHGVEQFLYREARLLDERRWDDWLELWAHDARLGVPTRRTPHRVSGGHRFDPAQELAGADDLWWFDDGFGELALRVAKLRTGKAWAEDPPSRTRRIVSNVEADDNGDGTVLARSNVLLHRSRRDSDVETVVSGRRDLLRPTDGGFVIAERLVMLDAKVLPFSDLAVFL